MSHHEFMTPTTYRYLRDATTGENFIPVAAMLAFVRARFKPDITEPELVERMTQVGWRCERATAQNPDNGDTITVDLFRSSPGWPGGELAEVEP